MTERRLAALVAFLIAGSVTAVTIRYATFVPWGTDSASYVTAARQWATADLFIPAPFQLWGLPWTPFALPLGARPGSVHGTEVSVYPPGFPLMLAVGHLVDPELGVYVIPPILAGVLVWAAFLLADRLAGPWAGVLAAALMAASPIALAHVVTVMSDVPAAAFLLLATAISIRGTAASAGAAGVALTAAVMTRPILAPFGVVLAALVLTSGTPGWRAWRQWRWRHAALFVVCAAIGPAIVIWSQRVLYGGYFVPGYVGWQGFFDTEHLLHNLSFYPRNMSAVHTPLLFLGLAGAIPLIRAARRHDPDAARLLLALVAIVVLNYLLFLPYLTFDQVWFTRFLLPAYAALFVLLAAATAHAAIAAARVFKPLAVLCVVPALIVMMNGRYLYPYLFSMADQQANVRLMGRYLDESLPANAAVITFLQSGAFAYYTGRQIVRYDLLHPPTLVDLLETLVRRGYRPAFLIDQQLEGPAYRELFASTRYERLEWPPRALFIAGTMIWYLEYGDRNAAREGREIPRDVLR